MVKANPNDLVVAVLHRVGSEPHLREDGTLAKLFNKASEEFPNVFGEFDWHPQYKDSKLLSKTLANLDIGGDIYHEAASGLNFRLSKRVAEDYGKKIYSGLPRNTKSAVDNLADSVRTAYSS